MHMPAVGSRYQDQLTVRIPNDPRLIGAAVYQQWMCVYSRCSPTCVVQLLRMSDGAQITIGI